MEYVQINHPDTRAVYVDDEDNGETNTIIRVGSGTHRFDLGEPKDYEPPFYEELVENTSALNPLVLQFTPKTDV